MDPLQEANQDHEPDYEALEDDLRRQAIDAVAELLKCPSLLAQEIVDLVLSKTRI